MASPAWQLRMLCRCRLWTRLLPSGQPSQRDKRGGQVRSPMSRPTPAHRGTLLESHAGTPVPTEEAVDDRSDTGTVRAHIRSTGIPGATGRYPVPVEQQFAHLRNLTARLGSRGAGGMRGHRRRDRSSFRSRARAVDAVRVAHRRPGPAPSHIPQHQRSSTASQFPGCVPTRRLPTPAGRSVACHRTSLESSAPRRQVRHPRRCLPRIEPAPCPVAPQSPDGWRCNPMNSTRRVATGRPGTAMAIRFHEPHRACR
jgi:hypothetical protein